MSDETVDDWTADQIRSYAGEAQMLRAPGNYPGYFVGAVKWKERVARMVARDRETIATQTATVARLRAERDDYKRAWQRDLEKGRGFLADLAAARESLAEARAALTWIGEHCDADHQGLALAEIQHFTVVALSKLAPPVPPPPPTPGPAMRFDPSATEHVLACDGTTVRAYADGVERPDLLAPVPPPPPCASWCGVRCGSGDGAECYPKPGVSCFCTPACRDAGAPRNPVKPPPSPCETCRGTREVASYSMALPAEPGEVALVGQGFGRAKAFVGGVERPELVIEEKRPCPTCTPGAKP